MSCVNLVLFSAGCRTKTEQKVLNETTTRIVEDVLNTNVTNVGTKVQNVQSLTINNTETGQILCPEGLNIGQYINSDSKIYTQISQSQITEINNRLQTEFVNSIEALAESDQNLFASIFGKAADVSSRQDVKNQYLTEWNKRVNTEAVTNVANDFINEQTLTINNAGIISGSMCNFDQKILQMIQIQNILTSIQKQLLKSELFEGLTQTAKVTAKTRTSLWGGSTWVYIVLIILLVIGFLLAWNYATKYVSRPVQIAIFVGIFIFLIILWIYT